MTEGKNIENEVEASGESFSRDFSYVLHGGKAYCPYGSRTSHLQVPLDHGTLIHDMPVMTVLDCKAQTNIQSFGVCSCPTNPDRLAKIEEIKANVKKSGGFLSKVMTFFCGESEDKETGKDLEQNVVIQCMPQFAISDMWEEGADKLRINGIKTLTSKCKVQCLKGDGEALIGIADDGQENAEKEKQGLCDFDNWQEGDPMPDASQRNVQNLEKNINELQDKIDNCKDPAEKAKLQKELDAKKDLQTKMTETKNTQDEISRQLETMSKCENPDQAVKDMEKDGSLQKMIDNGQIVDADGNKVTDVNEAKKLMKENIEASNDKYDQLEKAQKDLSDNYKNGYDQSKVDKIKEDIKN